MIGRGPIQVIEPRPYSFIHHPLPFRAVALGARLAQALKLAQRSDPVRGEAKHIRGPLRDLTVGYLDRP
jgi:hypothetical protein